MNNIGLNTISGEPVAATDEIGGVHYQRVKFVLGNEGINDGDVSSSNPLPVVQQGVSTDITAQAIRDLNDTMLYMLSAILEKMPRTTGNDQASVAIESGSVGLLAGQTLATVTNVTTLATLQTLSNITNIGGKNISAGADAIIMTGVAHIYNNIIVS
jgi:hypothetical protein